MKRTDPRYESYKAYQREYQRRRRQADPEYRAKRNWAVHKCYWMKKEKNGNAPVSNP